MKMYLRPREPIPAEEIPELLRKTEAAYKPGRDFPHGLRGVVIGMMNSLAGGTAWRKYLLKQLFGTSSSKRLTPAQWYALIRWAGPHPSDLCPDWCDYPGEGWHVHPAFAVEVRRLLDWFAVQEGQQSLPMNDDAARSVTQRDTQSNEPQSIGDVLRSLGLGGA